MSYLEKRMQHILDDRPEKVKVIKPMRKVSVKLAAKRAAVKEVRGEEDTDLQKWYAAIMEKENPVCWETGEWIGKPDKELLIEQSQDCTQKEIEAAFKKMQFGWHGSIAHVLPKEHYPSVMTHPLNYMILKMWGGTHGQYDSSWENASKMKVWNHAIKIFNILFPLLTPEEKRKLPDEIIQEIKPEIYNS